MSHNIPTLTTAIPDSIATFSNYPEIAILNKGFTKFNEHNESDSIRLIAYITNITQVCGKDQIKGDFLELGVYKGNTAAILAFYAEKYNRNLELFDTYCGFDERDLNGRNELKKMFSNTSVEEVDSVIRECSSIQPTHNIGYFPETVTESHLARRYSVISIDCDLGKPTSEALRLFYPLLNSGGIIIIHDYGSGWWSGLTEAVDDFLKQMPESVVVIPDKCGTAIIRKS